MLAPADVDLLSCPTCRSGGLAFRGREPDDLRDGVLQCYSCGSAWPLVNGTPHLFDANGVRGWDRFLRFVYDRIAPWHDLAVKFALPLMQLSSADVARAGYIRQLDLGTLRSRDDATPLRILEVGIGGGANLPLIEREVPTHLNYEVWGVDLSAGMLAQCVRRVARSRDARRVRLMLADAHRLPFASGSFDRVFHVGGINGYGEPRVALEEMARVARPGTPIVIVDEQLDRVAAQNPYYWLVFRAMTLYDGNPHAPRELLPSNAVVTFNSQVSRFYYCLTFKMPEANDCERSTTHREQAAQMKAHRRTTQENAMPPRTTNVDMMKPADVEKLKREYDDGTMNSALASFFPAHYPLTAEYIKTIEAAFYVEPASENGSRSRTKLSPDDRERCLISILASRGTKLTLAIHMYIALMNGVTDDEIAHILFLNGVYTGIDNLSFSLDVQQKTFDVLTKLAAKPQPQGPKEIVGALNAALSPPAPSDQGPVSRGAKRGRKAAKSSRRESRS
jgi:ubiquinone/menaquinone biosynthesis C-methylase UbiE/uncharacterized protein YbaR (Trm112 family)